MNYDIPILSFSFMYRLIFVLLVIRRVFRYNRNMKKDERRKRIIRQLRRQMTSSIAEMGRELNINRETLRRDIGELQRQGLITRINGKLYLNESQQTRNVLSQYGVLTKEERLQQMVELFKRKRQIRVTRLSHTFDVTPATIRSDLKELQRRGVIAVNHGYGELLDNTGSPFAAEREYGEDDKVQIVAARATGHVESGDIVYLDDSSFSQVTARMLEHARDVTVVTTSLQVAYVLTKREYPCEIVTLSGALKPLGNNDRPLISEPIIEQLALDKAFLGIATVAKSGQFALEDRARREVVRALCSSSKQVFACMTSDRLTHGQITEPVSSFEEISKSLAEIIVDEALDNDTARSVFPEHVPVALCGDDHTYYLSRNPGKDIGFSVYPGYFDFRQEVNESIENACKNREGCTLHRRQNSGTYETIIDNIDHLVAENVDLLIDYSSNYEVAVLVAQKAQKMSIPLIMVDLPVQNAVYFGANNLLAGQIAGANAARYITDHWSGKIDTILILEKAISGSVVRQRVIGSIHEIRERVQVNSKTIKHIDCTRGIDYYGHKLERYLDRLKPDETCLVLSFGEDTTVETHEMVSMYVKDRSIIMVGQNYSYHVAHMMQQPQSPLLGVVSYAQDQYGERIIDLATRLLEGQKVNPVNYTEHEWIPNPKFVADTGSTRQAPANGQVIADCAK